MDESRLQVLARPFPDGTYRARIFEGGVMTWQCSHRHDSIEAAWDCGARRARSLENASRIPPSDRDAG